MTGAILTKLVSSMETANSSMDITGSERINANDEDAHTIIEMRARGRTIMEFWRIMKNVAWNAAKTLGIT